MEYSNNHNEISNCLDSEDLVTHDAESSEVETQYYCEQFSHRHGYLHCEKIKVSDIRHWLEGQYGHQASPFFLYSRSKLVNNIQAYKYAMGKLKRKCQLNFAVKANINQTIVTIMHYLGCSATLVSGLELKMVLELGFDPGALVMNGNGKQLWEIEMAVQAGCLLNVDSAFNLHQTEATCEKLGKSARILLRVNPDIDPNVHEYNCTGSGRSKFGITSSNVTDVLEMLRDSTMLNLVGLHCHLGSTITSLDMFRKSAANVSALYHRIKADGFPDMTIINLGGGLGIENTKHKWRTSENKCDQCNEDKMRLPTPAEVVETIDKTIQDPDITMILEPGRSLIGDTALLVTGVIGVKHSKNKSFIVVDGSMTEVIRPALYGAYHHIDLVEPSISGDRKYRIYDVVGPVCESGDFLGKDRLLATPHEGCSLAVFDVGAYCASMASNYNFRPRPAEVLVDGDKCSIIRRPETYEDIMSTFKTGKKDVVEITKNFY